MHKVSCCASVSFLSPSLTPPLPIFPSSLPHSTPPNLPSSLPHSSQFLPLTLHPSLPQIIVTGTSAEGSQMGMLLARTLPGVLYCTAGLHPHTAKVSYQPSILESIREAQLLTLQAACMCCRVCASATQCSSAALGRPAVWAIYMYIRTCTCKIPCISTVTRKKKKGIRKVETNVLHTQTTASPAY